MRRNAFTMVELIMTIVIMGILAGGAYVSLAKLFAKSAQTKAISQLSLESTIIANQLTGLLRNRIPSTVIGYNPVNSSFESIYSITESYPILEWIGVDIEGLQERMYSGFVDLERCDREKVMLYSPSTDINGSDRALLFAGAFDDGDVVYNSTEFNDSFGWHGHAANKIFELNITSSGNNLFLKRKPDVVYEKYNLTKSAYALARYGDINQSASCINDLGLSNTLFKQSLLLFYDYRPWRGETFCADPGSSSGHAGLVTLLSTEASGFEADFMNGSLQLGFTLERTIRRPGKDLNITISKRKAVY